MIVLALSPANLILISTQETRAHLVPSRLTRRWTWLGKRWTTSLSSFLLQLVLRRRMSLIRGGVVVDHLTMSHRGWVFQIRSN